ncbi:MAG: carboxylesterase family protein, partial [Acidimicrobiales bacterium]
MFEGAVSTRCGFVRGAEADGVWSYRGIPYASAPLGRLRFRPPQPAP